MFYMKTRHLTALSLALILPAIALTNLPANAKPSSTPSVTKLSLNFKVPNRGAPPTTAGGASRGSCLPQSKLLMSVMPKQQIGLTLAERPSFFFYVPQSPAQTAEFVMLSGDDTEVVYQTTFNLPSKPGVARFDLPVSAPALQAGKSYHWYMTVLCDTAVGPSGNPSIEGWVERTTPERSLAKALKQAKPGDLPALYAEAGIWHETLASLADLRLRTPANTKLVTDWKQLLTSVGLGSVASEPLVACCTLANQ